MLLGQLNTVVIVLLQLAPLPQLVQGQRRLGQQVRPPPQGRDGRDGRPQGPRGLLLAHRGLNCGEAPDGGSLASRAPMLAWCQRRTCASERPLQLLVGPCTSFWGIMLNRPTTENLCCVYVYLVQRCPKAQNPRAVRLLSTVAACRALRPPLFVPALVASTIAQR